MFQTNSDLRASDLFRISNFGIRVSRRRRAFTLVEMLVVIGIVVVLVALLVPAGAIAISTARDATMSLEISQLAQAIETYKKEKGDYPPSFGEIDLYDVDSDGNILESLYGVAPYTSVVERHLRKCYPKMTTQEKNNFYQYIAPNINQAEALVFWLSQTQNDERNPFFGTSGNVKKYYDFKEERLIESGPIALGGSATFRTQAYKPAYARETVFVYIDSRTYLMHQFEDTSAPSQVFADNAFATSGSVQPYGDNPKALEIQQQNISNPPANQNEINRRKHYQYLNGNTFQIISAGQDGEFGARANQFDNMSNPTNLKTFKEGVNYTDEDEDNLTNFSEGKRLGNHIP